MKHNLTNFSSVLLTALLLNGCNSDSVAPTTIPATLSQATVASIAVKTTDGTPVSGLSVTVKNADTSGVAGKEGTYTTDALGFITVELKSAEASGRLEVTVDNASYFALTQGFDISAEKNQGTLTLTKKQAGGTNGSSGTEVITVAPAQTFTENTAITVPGQSNTLTGKVATINAASGTGVIAQVILPDTVTAQTASGQAAVGTIKVDAAVYKNSDIVSVDAFPGGLAIGNNLTHTANTPQPIVPNETAADDTKGFITAGFVSLDVKDSAGNKIEKFTGPSGVDIDGDGAQEQGLVVTTLVPKDTINPATKALVQAGELIPIWSYNSGTGDWTFEGNAKLFANTGDDKNWKAVFVASHLSSWNLDYFGYNCYSTKVNLIDNATGQKDNRSFLITLRRPGNGYYFKSTLLNNDGVINFNYIPREKLLFDFVDINTNENIPVQKVAVRSGTPSTYDSTGGVNICNSPNNYDFYLKASTAITYKSVNLQVTESCSNSSLNAYNNRPTGASTWAILYKVTGSSLTYLNTYTIGTNGKTTLSNLASSGKYRLYVWDRVNNNGYKTLDFQASSAANPITVDLQRTNCATPTTGTATAQ